MLSLHRHPQNVHEFVLKGTGIIEQVVGWQTGSYVFEPPGETHPLVVPEGVDEMMTFFERMV